MDTSREVRDRVRRQRLRPLRAVWLKAARPANEDALDLLPTAHRPELDEAGIERPVLTREERLDQVCLEELTISPRDGPPVIEVLGPEAELTHRSLGALAGGRAAGGSS